jgi:hypothetical protein
MEQLKVDIRYTVTVETLGYNPECRGFETRLGVWIFSTYLNLSITLDPRVYSTYNRNENQKQKNNVSEEQRVVDV